MKNNATYLLNQKHGSRMIMLEDGRIIFSIPAAALKETIRSGNANNDKYREATALMLAAECEGRMTDHE